MRRLSIISILLIALSACTAGRHSQRSAHSHTHHSLYQDSTHWQAYGWQQQVAVGWQAYQADILPLGPFTYHPDTGYRGTAAWLRISGLAARKHQETGAQVLDLRRETRMADSSERFDASVSVSRPAYSVVRHYGTGILLLALLLGIARWAWRRSYR